MGLTGAFSREIAKLSVVEGTVHKMRDLCRTFEFFFAAIGLFGTVGIILCSPTIAQRWVNADHLTIAEVSSAIILIGIAVGFQFPFSLYQGGMLGLQRQVSLNVLLLGVALLRGTGAVFILACIDASVRAFFLWQVVVSGLQLLIGRLLLWRSFATSTATPRFDIKLVLPLWRFAAGTAGITFSGILLTQVDKLILTKMLPLENFGYYTLAGVVAGVPSMIAIPLNAAIYPRMTQLVVMKNEDELVKLYHHSSQLLAALVLPVGLIITRFSKEVMLLWTGNLHTAESTYQIVSVLVMGSTITGLMFIPYALQLAHGWTSLSLVFNLTGAAILIPCIIILTGEYGALGASFMWVAINVAYVSGMVHIMHRRILRFEKWRWYLEDICKPLVAALFVIAVCDRLVYIELSRPELIVRLGLVMVLTMSATILSVTSLRSKVFEAVHGLSRI